MKESNVNCRIWIGRVATTRLVLVGSLGFETVYAAGGAKKDEQLRRD